MLGIAGTGRSIALDGIDHFVCGEATVITNTVVFDQMAFARQVGLLPADRSATDRALKGAVQRAHPAGRCSPATD